MCYFSCKAKNITLSRSFNLISNSWSNPRWRPLLMTSQASSGATTLKIYLSLLRRSKAFHWRQNRFEILQHIKNSAEGFHSCLRLPCTTVGVWIFVYVQGLKHKQICANLFFSSGDISKNWSTQRWAFAPVKQSTALQQKRWDSLWSLSHSLIFGYF